MICAKKVYFSDEIGYNYFRHQGTISLPTTIEKLYFYLTSATKVAFLIKQNLIIPLPLRTLASNHSTH